MTLSDGLPGVAMLPPDGKPSQQWKVACDDDNMYTVASVATGLYLGSDVRDEMQMIVKGTKTPYPWWFEDGPDDDETTHILMAGNLVLAMSILRIYPPLVAILPRSDRFVEWAFDPA